MRFLRSVKIPFIFCGDISRMKFVIKYFLPFILLGQLSVNAQALDNLQMLFSLADSSVNAISPKLSDGEKYFLKTTNPAEYNLLAERAKYSFVQAGIEVSEDSSFSNVINYSIENARIEYPDVFRDGWFGDYLVERKAELSGSVLIETDGKNQTEEFNIAKTDTINFDKIRQSELPSLPFTQGDVPAEPFFSSLWEPIIAIGAVVVTVVLLFTTRTK